MSRLPVAGAVHYILTLPVAESIEVVGTGTYDGVVAATMVVADEKDPHPNML